MVPHLVVHNFAVTRYVVSPCDVFLLCGFYTYCVRLYRLARARGVTSCFLIFVACCLHCFASSLSTMHVARHFIRDPLCKPVASVRARLQLLFVSTRQTPARVEP